MILISTLKPNIKLFISKNTETVSNVEKIISSNLYTKTKIFTENNTKYYTLSTDAPMNIGDTLIVSIFSIELIKGPMFSKVYVNQNNETCIDKGYTPCVLYSIKNKTNAYFHENIALHKYFKEHCNIKVINILQYIISFSLTFLALFIMNKYISIDGIIGFLILLFVFIPMGIISFGLLLLSIHNIYCSVFARKTTMKKKEYDNLLKNIKKEINA